MPLIISGRIRIQFWIIWVRKLYSNDKTDHIIINFDKINKNFYFLNIYESFSPFYKLWFQPFKPCYESLERQKGWDVFLKYKNLINIL